MIHAEFINNNNIKKIVIQHDEIVIYGAGNMGEVVIKNLINRGWRDRIVCCAVKSRNENPRNVMDIPVIELKWLSHLRETACFIIAVAEDKQKEIYDNLVQFGCKNIKLMEYKYALEIQFHQMNQLSSDRVLKEKLVQLEEKMNQIEYQIYEQNEVCAVNTKTFAQFENCNYGKDIVIVASGPTMQYYVPKVDTLHIGVNFTWKRTDIPFDYFFIQDGNREYIYLEMLNGTIENVRGDIFIGRFLKNCPWKGSEYQILCGENKNIRRYFVDTLTKNIYQNICFHPLMDFHSVIFPALHFALYTYPKRIYLVGCDVSNKGDFDQMKYVFPRWQLNILKYGYAMVKEFVTQYYPETEIISVNPVGLKGLFKDMYTKEFTEKRKVFYDSE